MIDSGLGVPREQKMLKEHLPRVIYITKYTSIRRLEPYVWSPLSTWREAVVCVNFINLPPQVDGDGVPNPEP